MKRMPAAVAAALALWAGAAAGQGPASFAATYVCDGGAVLRVAYLNPPDGPSMAVIDWAGVLVPMRTAPTASGVFYVDLDEQRGLRWRTKGAEGMLGRLAADHTATEETLLSDCATATRP